MTNIIAKPGGFFWETPQFDAKEALDVLADRLDMDRGNRTAPLICSVVEGFDFWSDMSREARHELIQLLARNNTVTTQSAFKHLVECLKAAEEAD